MYYINMNNIFPNQNGKYTTTTEQNNDNYDDFCELDPTKICDNCFKCLNVDGDYVSIKIDEIKTGK